MDNLNRNKYLPGQIPSNTLNHYAMTHQRYGDTSHAQAQADPYHLTASCEYSQVWPAHQQTAQTRTYNPVFDHRNYNTPGLDHQQRNISPRYTYQENLSRIVHPNTQQSQQSVIQEVNSENKVETYSNINHVYNPYHHHRLLSNHEYCPPNSELFSHGTMDGSQGIVTRDDTTHKTVNNVRYVPKELGRVYQPKSFNESLYPNQSCCMPPSSTVYNHEFYQNHQRLIDKSKVTNAEYANHQKLFERPKLTHLEYINHQKILDRSKLHNSEYMYNKYGDILSHYEDLAQNYNTRTINQYMSSDQKSYASMQKTFYNRSQHFIPQVNQQHSKVPPNAYDANRISFPQTCYDGVLKNKLYQDYQHKNNSVIMKPETLHPSVIVSRPSDNNLTYTNRLQKHYKDQSYIKTSSAINQSNNNYPGPASMRCMEIKQTHYEDNYGPKYPKQDLYFNSRQPQYIYPSTIYSPNVISPTDSNVSDTSSTKQYLLDECSYVSRCSTSSSIGSVFNHDSEFKNPLKCTGKKGAPEVAVKHNYASDVENFINTSIVKRSSDNDKDKLDLRKFLSTWDESDDEVVSQGIENNLDNMNSNEQLYILEYTDISSEDLDKYKHITQVTELPENIRDFTSITNDYNVSAIHHAQASQNEKKFGHDINCNNHINEQIGMQYTNNISKNVEKLDHEVLTNACKSNVNNDMSLYKSNSNLNAGKFNNDHKTINDKPPSPVDIETILSQSVISKEAISCSFDIKPCDVAPKQFSVHISHTDIQPNADLKSTTDIGVQTLFEQNIEKLNPCDDVNSSVSKQLVWSCNNTQKSAKPIITNAEYYQPNNKASFYQLNQETVSNICSNDRNVNSSFRFREKNIFTDCMYNENLTKNFTTSTIDSIITDKYQTMSQPCGYNSINISKDVQRNEVVSKSSLLHNQSSISNDTLALKDQVMDDNVVSTHKTNLKFDIQHDVTRQNSSNGENKFEILSDVLITNQNKEHLLKNCNYKTALNEVLPNNLTKVGNDNQNNDNKNINFIIESETKDQQKIDKTSNSRNVQNEVNHVVEGQQQSCIIEKYKKQEIMTAEMSNQFENKTNLTDETTKVSSSVYTEKENVQKKKDHVTVNYSCKVLSDNNIKMIFVKDKGPKVYQNLLNNCERKSDALIQNNINDKDLLQQSCKSNNFHEEEPLISYENKDETNFNNDTKFGEELSENQVNIINEPTATCLQINNNTYRSINECLPTEKIISEVPNLNGIINGGQNEENNKNNTYHNIDKSVPGEKNINKVQKVNEIMNGVRNEENIKNNACHSIDKSISIEKNISEVQNINEIFNGAQKEKDTLNNLQNVLKYDCEVECRIVQPFFANTTEMINCNDKTSQIIIDNNIGEIKSQQNKEKDDHVFNYCSQKIEIENQSFESENQSVPQKILEKNNVVLDNFTKVESHFSNLCNKVECKADNLYTINGTEDILQKMTNNCDKTVKDICGDFNNLNILSREHGTLKNYSSNISNISDHTLKHNTLAQYDNTQDKIQSGKISVLLNMTAEEENISNHYKQDDGIIKTDKNLTSGIKVNCNNESNLLGDNFKQNTVDETDGKCCKKYDNKIDNDLIFLMTAKALRVQRLMKKFKLKKKLCTTKKLQANYKVISKNKSFQDQIINDSFDCIGSKCAMCKIDHEEKSTSSKDNVTSIEDLTLQNKSFKVNKKTENIGIKKSEKESTSFRNYETNSSLNIDNLQEKMESEFDIILDENQITKYSCDFIKDKYPIDHAEKSTVICKDDLKLNQSILKNTGLEDLPLRHKSFEKIEENIMDIVKNRNAEEMPKFISDVQEIDTSIHWNDETETKHNFDQLQEKLESKHELISNKNQIKTITKCKYTVCQEEKFIIVCEDDIKSKNSILAEAVIEDLTLQTKYCKFSENTVDVVKNPDNENAEKMTFIFGESKNATNLNRNETNSYHNIDTLQKKPENENELMLTETNKFKNSLNEEIIDISDNCNIIINANETLSNMETPFSNNKIDLSLKQYNVENDILSTIEANKKSRDHPFNIRNIFNQADNKEDVPKVLNSNNSDTCKEKIIQSSICKDDSDLIEKHIEICDVEMACSNNIAESVLKLICIPCDDGLFVPPPDENNCNISTEHQNLNYLYAMVSAKADKCTEQQLEMLIVDKSQVQDSDSLEFNIINENGSNEDHSGSQYFLFIHNSDSESHSVDYNISEDDDNIHENVHRDSFSHEQNLQVKQKLNSDLCLNYPDNKKNTNCFTSVMSNEVEDDLSLNNFPFVEEIVCDKIDMVNSDDSYADWQCDINETLLSNEQLTISETLNSNLDIKNDTNIEKFNESLHDKILQVGSIVQSPGALLKDVNNIYSVSNKNSKATKYIHKILNDCVDHNNLFKKTDLAQILSKDDFSDNSDDIFLNKSLKFSKIENIQDILQQVKNHNFRSVKVVNRNTKEIIEYRNIEQLSHNNVKKNIDRNFGNVNDKANTSRTEICPTSVEPDKLTDNLFQNNIADPNFDKTEHAGVMECIPKQNDSKSNKNKNDLCGTFNEGKSTEFASKFCNKGEAISGNCKENCENNHVVVDYTFDKDCLNNTFFKNKYIYIDPKKIEHDFNSNLNNFNDNKSNNKSVFTDNPTDDTNSNYEFFDMIFKKLLNDRYKVKRKIKLNENLNLNESEHYFTEYSDKAKLNDYALNKYETKDILNQSGHSLYDEDSSKKQNLAVSRNLHRNSSMMGIALHNINNEQMTVVTNNRNMNVDINFNSEEISNEKNMKINLKQHILNQRMNSSKIKSSSSENEDETMANSNLHRTFFNTRKRKLKFKRKSKEVIQRRHSISTVNCDEKLVCSRKRKRYNSEKNVKISDVQINESTKIKKDNIKQVEYNQVMPNKKNEFSHSNVIRNNNKTSDSTRNLLSCSDYQNNHNSLNDNIQLTKDNFCTNKKYLNILPATLFTESILTKKEFVSLNRKPYEKYEYIGDGTEFIQKSEYLRLKYSMDDQRLGIVPADIKLNNVANSSDFNIFDLPLTIENNEDILTNEMSTNNNNKTVVDNNKVDLKKKRNPNSGFEDKLIKDNTIYMDELFFSEKNIDSNKGAYEHSSSLLDDIYNESNEIFKCEQKNQLSLKCDLQTDYKSRKNFSYTYKNDTDHTKNSYEGSKRNNNIYCVNSRLKKQNIDVGNIKQQANKFHNKSRKRNFEDVLTSIDEQYHNKISKKKHTQKHIVPKLIIKRDDYGMHYAREKDSNRADEEVALITTALPSQGNDLISESEAISSLDFVKPTRIKLRISKSQFKGAKTHESTLITEGNTNLNTGVISTPNYISQTKQKVRESKLKIEEINSRLRNTDLKLEAFSNFNTLCVNLEKRKDINYLCRIPDCRIKILSDDNLVLVSKKNEVTENDTINIDEFIESGDEK